MKFTLLSLILALTLSAPLLAAESRGPSGCPAGVDSTKWVCLTREEAQAVKLKSLDAQDQIIDLREQVAKLRAANPISTLRRYVRPWASVGLERGLNDGVYTPYATGGVTLGGHVDVWAGVWGSDPSVGVGWEF